MSNTDQQEQADFNHFLDVILGYKQDDHPVRLTFQKNYITEISDVLCMSDETIFGLKYNIIGDKNKTITTIIPPPFASRLIQFKHFVRFNAGSGHPVTTNIQAVTKQDFNHFISSTDTSVNPLPSPVPTPVATSTVASKSVDKVREFRKGTKHDVTVFPELNRNTNWRTWNGTTII